MTDSKIESLEKELNSIKKTLQFEEKQRDDLENENRDLERQLKLQQQQVKRLKDDLDYESKERDNLEKENFNASQKVKHLEAKIQILSTEKNTFEQDIIQLQTAKRRVIEKTEKEKQELENENDTLRDEIRQLKREVREKGRKYENKIDDLERELKRAAKTTRQDQEIQRLNRELSYAQSQLKLQISASSPTSSSSSSSPSGKQFDEKAVNEILLQKKNVEDERDKLQEKINSLNQEITQFKKEKESFDQYKKEVEEEKQKARKKAQEKLNEREEINKQVNGLEEEVKSLKNELKEAGDFATNSAKRELSLRNEINELKISLQLLERRRQQAEDDRDELEEQFSTQKVESKELESELQERIEELENTLRQQQQHQGSGVSQEEVDLLQRELEKGARDKKGLEEELNCAAKRITDLEAELRSAKKDVSELQTTLKQVQETAKTLEESHFTEVDKLKRKAEKDLIDIKEQLNVELNNVERLENQVKQMEIQLKEFKTKEGSETIRAKQKYVFELSTTQENLMQAQKAHKKLDEELRDANVKIETLNNKKNKMKQDIEMLKETMQERENESKQHLEQLKNSYEETIRNLENSAKEVRDEKFQLQTQLEGLEMELKNAKNEADKTKKRLQTETSEVQERLEQAEQDKKKWEQEVITLRHQAQQTSSSPSSSQVELQEQQKLVHQLQEQLKQLQHDEQQLKKKTKALEDDIEDLNEDLEDERLEKKRLSAAKKKGDQEFYELQENFRGLSLKTDQMVKQQRLLESELKEKDDQLKRQTEKVMRSEEDHHQKQEQLQNDLSLLKLQLKQVQEQMEKSKEENKKLANDNKTLEEELKNEREGHKKSGQNNDQELNKVKEDARELRSQVLLLEKSREQERQEVQKANNQAHQLQTKLSHTKERKSFWKDKVQRHEQELKAAQIAKEKTKTELERLRQQLVQLEGVQQANALLTKKVETLKQNASAAEELTEARSEILRLKKQLSTSATNLLNNSNNNNTSSGPSEFSELGTVGPRLAVPRKPLGPRQIRKGVSPLTSGASADDLPETPASTSTTTTATDPSRLGGVNVMMATGASLGAVVLKKTSNHSPSGGAVSLKKGATKKLWCLKGRRRVRSFLVECSHKGMNKGDVFILDGGDKIFQWNGSECNRMERTKAKDITSRLNRQKGNRAEVVVIDEDDNDEGMFKFWTELGAKGVVKSAKEGGDDLEVENTLDSQTTLYCIHDDLSLVPVQGKLVQEMLDTSKCFVLNCENEVYLWTGKQSDRTVRAQAVGLAQQIFESQARAPWSEVFKEVQGGESVWFCEKFTNWSEGASFINVGSSSSPNTRLAKTPRQESIDVQKLHKLERPEKSGLRKQVEWSSECKLEIWKVVDASKEAVETEAYGQFWAGHSYVIQLKYGPDSDPSYNIYFWQGRGCSKNEKGTSAALALNLAKKLPGANQIRETQNKESAEFLRLFQGRFVVHLGKDSDPQADAALYHVRGNLQGAVSTFQVPAAMNRLNGGDCFVLLNNKGSNNHNKGTAASVWIGDASQEEEQKAAAQVAALLAPGSSAVTVKQGAESRDFVELLGGKEDYLPGGQPRKIKFFQFTTRTGTLSADRVWDWSHDDLELAVLLDTWDVLYLWLAKTTRENDKKLALKTAVEYLEAIPTSEKRPKDIPVLTVIEGEEPTAFISHFHGWDRPIMKVKREGLRRVKSLLEDYNRTFTLSQLQDKSSLPDTVDKSCLEEYLNDDDFLKTFGMDKDAWQKLAPWRKTKLKQDKGLY